MSVGPRDESLATVAQPSRTSFPELSLAGSIATPEEAIWAFEARRSWAFSIGLAVAALAGLVLVFLIGGDPLARNVHVGGLLAAGGVASWYAATTRNVGDYRLWKIRALTYVTLFTNATGYYYWGVFSAYSMLVSVSAYSVSSGSGRATASKTALVLSIVGHGGLGLAQILGWIDERSLVTAPVIAVGWQIAILVMLNLVLVGAIYIGYDAHNTLRSVVDAHGAAQQLIAQREVQLAEAHAEVLDARRPGDGRLSGQTLGRFTLREVLGRGAMGEVYAGLDDTGRSCAVKVLAAHLVGDDRALQRFHREAKAIAAIDSPNIVRMIEVSPPGAAQPFLAMERLAGEDLAARLKAQPVFPIGDVVSLVRAVATGLDAAHAAGVVHRDLKPANIFAATGTDGRVTWKILDFGVSKLTTADATMTANQLVGTPSYMSPEQARGDELDRRTDVYSLGVLAYRLLTGRPVVKPADVPAMLHDVVYEMPQAPSLVRELPPEVDAVLALALAKVVGERFSTAGELAASLAEAAAGFGSPTIAARAQTLLRERPWGRPPRSRAKTVAG